MPAGLQIWDSSSNIILDTPTIVGRQIGVVDASAMSGSVTVAGLDQGNPYAIPIMDASSAYATYASTTLPVVTFSGTTLSWTRQALPNASFGSVPGCSLLVGVN